MYKIRPELVMIWLPVSETHLHALSLSGPPTMRLAHNEERGHDKTGLLYEFPSFDDSSKVHPADVSERR